MFGDSIYSISGQYVQSFQSYHGCDSLVVLNLEVIKEPPEIVIPYVTIPIDTDTLFNVIQGQPAGLDSFTLEFLNWHNSWPFDLIDESWIGVNEMQSTSDSFDLSYKLCSTSCPDLCTLGSISIIFIDNNIPDVEFLANEVISPNDDGKNDQFIVYNIAQQPHLYPNAQIQIMHRSGVVVYKENHFTGYWDGRNQGGSRLPSGAYFYIVKYDDTYGPTFFGHVTIVSID